MARGRMISQSVATDKRLNSISEDAELAFLKAIPHLDRDGLIIGDPVLLAAKICPRRPKLIAEMDSIIEQWRAAGLVIVYAPGEDQVLFFLGFAKNQTGMRYDREPASIYPPPPGYHRNGNGLESNHDSSDNTPHGNDGNPQTSGKHPANIRQTSGTLPPEVEVEVEVEENKKETKTDAAGADGGDSSLSIIGWQEVMRAYESNIGSFTAMSSELVRASAEEHGATVVVDAITEAVRQNVRKWAYVDGILKRWKANGRNGENPKPVKPPRQAQKITIFNQYTNQYEEKLL